MLKNITRILPFFIITLLSIGGVELLYGVAERYLLMPRSKAVVQESLEVEPGAPAEALQKHTNYKVILDRNLFQSYVEEPKIAEPVKENVLEGLKATTLDLVLMGTISGIEKNSRAIIMEKAKKNQDIYYKGDVIQGAQIKEILRAKVILTYQGKDEILDMTEASKYKPRSKAAVGSSLNNKKAIKRPLLRPRRPTTSSARPKPRRVPVSKREPPEESGSDLDGDVEEKVVEPEEPTEQDEPDEENGDESPRDTDADGRQKPSE